MVKSFKLLLFSMLFTHFGIAQEVYWVFLTDKPDVGFDPLTYFDAKAIQRRIIQDIPLNDQTDWPLNTNYVAQVSEMSDSYVGESRWFNAVAVEATELQLQSILNLPFVKSVQATFEEGSELTESKKAVDVTQNIDFLRARQIQVMGGDLFDSAGIDGKGVRVAVFDGGFPDVDVHRAFETIRNEKRIIATYNFPQKEEDVYKKNAHGLATFSNIAGSYDDGQKMGLATGAEFLLARTEVGLEPRKEEVYWQMAVEWADKLGAQIISSSLGYTHSRYMQYDMDGQKSLVTRAANMAARKGILVVTAAGNDGDNYWKVLGAPADADSALTVGGISPEQNTHINFGSYGPTADGRIKPNVSNYAKAVVASKDNSYKITYGTSFSTPLTSGFAACVLQHNPGLKVMDLFELIEKSAHLYPYYDYAHGYGIPQAAYILNESIKPVKGFETSWSEKDLVIKVTHTDSKNAKANRSINQDRLYVHVVGANGTLNRYWLIQVSEGDEILFDSSDFGDDPKEISVFLNGYVSNLTIQQQ